MICFIRPSNIRITPAFDRVIECNNLLEKNICITVIQWLKSGEKVGSSLEKITYCNYYGERTIKGYFGWFFFIFGNLRKKQPHYIHTFSFLNWFGIYPYFLFIKDARVFYDCRDYFAWAKNYSPLKSFIIRRFDCYFSKKAHTIIFPDKIGYKYFKTNQEKFKIVPNTVEDLFYGTQPEDLILKTKNNNLKLAFLGYTSKDRNIDAFLKAVKINPNIELHIASTYISKNVEISLNAPNIIFHGKLTRKNTIDLLRKCHYCLIVYDPSLKNYQHIQPTKFYDALMANVPFICSKGMHALEKYTSNEWANIAIEYNNIDDIMNIKFPKLNTKNRELYLLSYQYKYIIEKLGKIYEMYLNNRTL